MCKYMECAAALLHASCVGYLVVYVGYLVVCVLASSYYCILFTSMIASLLVK